MRRRAVGSGDGRPLGPIAKPAHSTRIRVRCAPFALTMINDALVVLSACGGGDGRDESLCDGGGRARQRHAAAARDDQTAEHRVCECE